MKTSLFSGTLIPLRIFKESTSYGLTSREMPGYMGWNSDFGGFLGLSGRPVQQHSILSNIINYIMIESILIIPLSELAEINGCMAQCTVLELKLLNLGFIHLVLASLASVVISGGDGLATDHTCWKITATGTAYGIVLAYRLFAVSSWTF